MAAIADAGIGVQEIDGICGTGMTPLAMGGSGFLGLQGALGIESVTWVENGWLGSALVFAAQAVAAGACDTALLVQSNMRRRHVARDPFRARAARFSDGGGDAGLGDFAKRGIHSGEPYAAIMRRYMRDFGWEYNAFQVAHRGMCDRSDLTLADVDIFYPYDGYTMGAIAVTEPAGYCKPGEATDLYHSAWDPMRQILLLNGRVPVNTGGGGLAHGRAGGNNLYSQAVRQLRGGYGERQVPGARTALIGIGSFFHDPSAVLLRT